MIVGLLVWFLFTKWKKVNDLQIAELGKIVFAFSFLVVIYSMLNKMLF